MAANQLVFTSEDVFDSIQNDESIKKVEEYRAYDVIMVKSINTKYGKKMIMTTLSSGTYWVPANLVKFIIKYPQIKEGFTLLTHENKTYKSNNGIEYQAPEFKVFYPSLKEEDLDKEPYYKPIGERLEQYLKDNVYGKHWSYEPKIEM